MMKVGTKFPEYPDFHLVQFNYATAKGEIDDPVMADFVAALDRINTLADGSPGFVWRLQTDTGHSSDIRPWPDHPLRLVTYSIWEEIEPLVKYVYSSEHGEFMRRRGEWFERPAPGEPYLVLWWVEKGIKPSVEEAVAKLAFLAKNGNTPEAFGFRSLYSPYGELIQTGT